MRKFMHDKENNRFILQLQNQMEASLDYTLQGNNMRLVYSEVPLDLRGRGIGKELVERSFEQLTDEGFTATAICSYIRAVAKGSSKWKTIIN